MYFPKDNLFDQSCLDDFEKGYSFYLSAFSPLNMDDNSEEENEFPPQYFKPKIEGGEEEKKSTEISAPYFITSYLNSGKKYRGRQVSSEENCSKKRRIIHPSWWHENILFTFFSI